MATKVRRPRELRERAKTNQSLRLERQKADKEVEKRAARTGQDADKVVRTARMRAASVLTGERRKADKRSAGPGDRAGARVGRDRAKADEGLRREYAAADTRISQDRATHVRALTKLFLAERQVTDERLNIERERSDHLLSARDELLAQVSHDLRGFLGTIALRTEFLHGSLPSNGESPLAAPVRAIQETTVTMTRLLGDLLDAASMESGTFRITKNGTGLDGMVLMSADVFREAAAAKGITLTVATTEWPPVRFDHARILQVLANLVGNAIKFTPKGGTIAIRLKGSRGQCEVSVADTGIGIPEANLGGIFDRFTQVKAASRGGLGLGLFIVRSIVEAHRGKVWAESVPGRGSTFYFTLPATSSKRRIAPAERRLP